MKIPAILTCLLAAVLSALPLSQARADSDVSFDVFYNSLADQGDWYNTPDYGYVWQPSIAYQNDKWRPYSDGYWAQTDDGWTWVSYENFGWATYHYGRWTNLEGTGWVWVPGYDWGPGWVSWRSSDDYVGWAPLPPRPASAGGAVATVDYNTVEPQDGYDASVDEQYDIGPSNYCFVETRYFGAPVLREVILPPQRNVIIIENTVNITHITYRREGPRVVVFNGGPDFAFLSGRVERPIQRLRIERDDRFDFAHVPRDHNPNLVRDGVFRIAAPTIAPRPVNFAQVRPPTVKRDIRDARVEHGWNNTGADQATVQRLRQQFQQQARQAPTRPPGGNPAAGLNPPGRVPDNARGGFTPPANNSHDRDARATVPPANPAAANTPPRGNTDADRRARRDAAQHEKEERDAARTNENNGGGFKPPTAAPGNTPRRAPSPEELTHEPAVAPTPAREANPNREGRSRNPAATPAHLPSEPSNNASEEVRHTPRQPEQTHAQPPSRETETQERPTRPQEQLHAQPPPSAPRQEPREVRENRPAPQPAAPPQQRQEVHESHENRPQPSGTEDPKKKPNGQ